MATLERLFAPDSTFQKRFFFLAKRFVAGETIEAAISAVRELNEAGMTVSLDFLGEDILERAAALKIRDTYFALFDAIHSAGVHTNVSVKLTALGLRIDEDFCFANLVAILERAQALEDPFVRIDMEGSAVTDATLRVFERAHANYSNVGQVLQAYLKRTPRDVERAIALGTRVRLCKGAYNEPAEISYRAMPRIREQYLECARELLARGNYPGIATHDPRLIEGIKEFVLARGIAHERFEFQMLYGVRPQMQRQMIREGYHLRIYVPFGTHWAGYFYRRVAERRENMLFAISSIFSR